MKKLSILAVSLLALAGAIISCKPQEQANVPVQSVSLDKAELELTAGETGDLKATVLPANATNRSVNWTSSDENVATVSQTGSVSAVAAGSANITVTTLDGGLTASCAVTVKRLIPEGAVDLGLPSGLLWASCNVGASKPEEFGDYFAWGDPEVYYTSKDPIVWKPGKEAGYEYEAYKWCKGTENTITKYSCTAKFGYNGFVDNKNVMDPEDDPAHVHLGGKWRTPTLEELSELMKNKWEWTTRNGVSGYLVTSNNGNSIFLPAAGGWKAEGQAWPDMGRYMICEAEKERPQFCFVLAFSSTQAMGGWGMPRCRGMAVRPVCD